MIVDSHAHAFPPMGGPSGHRSTREHMRYVQHLLMFHHQPVRRVSDNSIYTGANLLHDGKDFSLDGLTDVNYRGGTHGKFVWTADGVDYSLQYLPPTLTNLHAPPELMVAQMDYAGVDKAVLQTGHAYGRLNRYLSEAARKFPERFWALAMIDEWRADHPGQIRALDQAIGELGLHGLWFQSSNLRQHNRTEAIDDPSFYPFWDHVREMGIPVYWFVTAVFRGREPYMAELAAFERWAQRYPEIPVMFTHGLPLFRFMQDGAISIPEEAWKAMAAPNVLIEILIPIFQGAIWQYPYVEAQPIIRQYYERFGPDKLAWGSDMPNVERHCTYRQSLDYLRLHCDFIPPHDMSRICGDNVARLFGE
jgi:predicted TIM-barrel fold metal-dependent hydrolase